MKTKGFFSVIVVMMLVISSCNKNDTNDPAPSEIINLPAVTTVAVNNVTATEAMVYGSITDNGAIIESYGFCYSDRDDAPSISDDTIATTGGDEKSFNAKLKLLPDQIYYVRAYAKNSAGKVGYGNVLRIYTLGAKPQVWDSIADISDTWVVFTFKVKANLLPTKVTFEYGAIPDYGHSISYTVTNDTTGTITITGLTCLTTYYYRLTAVNAAGTVSTDSTFKTMGPSVTDIDGNVYKSVKIGDQIWTTTNLKVTHYNDGTPIPYITGKEMENTFKGAYCCYDDSPDTAKVYGLLYNWYAIEKLAPKGWHVPTEAEWIKLAIASGDASLKEAGYSHWQQWHYNSTNSTGFSALPGGI